MILDLALEHERLELAQENAPAARVVVVPEEVFEKEVEVVEPDAGAGTGPDEVSAVDAPVVWGEVGRVGKALLGESVASEACIRPCTFWPIDSFRSGSSVKSILVEHVGVVP